MYICKYTPIKVGKYHLKVLVKNVNFDPLPNDLGNYHPVIYANETTPEGIKVIQKRADTSSFLKQRRHSMTTNNKFIRLNFTPAKGSDRYIMELKEYYTQTIYLFTHDKYGNPQLHSNDDIEVVVDESCPYRLRSIIRGEDVDNEKDKFKITREDRYFAENVKKNSNKNVYKCEFVLKDYFEHRLVAKGFAALLESDETIECIVHIKCNGGSLPQSPFILKTNLDGSNQEKQVVTLHHDIDETMTFKDTYSSNSPQEFQRIMQERNDKEKASRRLVYNKNKHHHRRQIANDMSYNTSEEEEEEEYDEYEEEQDDRNGKKRDNENGGALYGDNTPNIVNNNDDNNKTKPVLVTKNMMLNYSPVKTPMMNNTSIGKNDLKKFIPSRTEDYIANVRNETIYPSLAEYIRGEIYEHLKKSPFSSLKVMQPDIRAPMAAPAMEVLERYVYGLWMVFIEYRYRLKRQTEVQLKQSESWNVPNNFNGWELYRDKCIKLKHYMLRNQLQELLLDFDVIPTLLSKRQVNSVADTVMNNDAEEEDISNNYYDSERTRRGRPTKNNKKKINVAVQKIEFPEFVEIIIRIAILSFQSEGYNRLYPKKEMKLEAFMNEWGFANVSKLRNIISYKARIR